MDTLTFLEHCKRQVEEALNATLPPITTSPHRLHKAMRYSILNGGKRLRSALIYAIGEALHAEKSVLTLISMAIEMIHAGSLIHDDLPALDNDDLRRGIPTCHIAFGEATAILTGDALQSLTFETIATLDEKKINPHIKVKMIQILSHAIGSYGMIGGEELDIEMVNAKVSPQDVENMYQLKTGRIFAASLLLGALASNQEDTTLLFHLEQFGNLMGVSFQIHDDIIGIQSDTQTLGKKQGADLELNKPVYPALVGMENAQKRRNELYQLALEHYEQTKINSPYIRPIADYLIHRTH